MESSGADMSAEPRPARLGRNVRATLLCVASLVACSQAHAFRECEVDAVVLEEGRCARLRGAEIFYHDTGPAAAQPGEAVILLHANSGNSDVFKENMRALSAA